MQVEDYLAKLKYICTEADNEKRDQVSADLLSQITSTHFLTILKAIYGSQADIYDAGTKIVTAALLKQFVKDNCKRFAYEDTTKLIDLILQLIWSNRSTVEMKEELGDSIKLIIIRANSSIV